MGWVEWFRQKAPILGLIAGALVLLSSAIGGDHGFSRVWRLWQDLDRAGEKNFELVQSIARLSKAVAAIRQDDAELTRTAHSKAHLARPDEVLYLLPRRDDAPPRRRTPDRE